MEALSPVVDRDSIARLLSSFRPEPTAPAGTVAETLR
jgi:hypothetical protein